MATHRSIFRIFSVIFIFIFVLVVKPNQSVYSTSVVLYAKPAASGTGDCSTWDNACTLQTALTNSASGSEIWAAAGTHKPTTGSDRSVSFLLVNGVAVYGGFSGVETSRAQRDPLTNLTIMSGDVDDNDSQKPVITDISTVTGNENNTYHVVTGASGATLDGFTITAGYSDDNGAGMYNLSTSPTLINVIFSGNLANNIGGAIYNNSSAATLTNVTFSSNRAVQSGGGMYNFTSSPILSNVTFSGNKADSDDSVNGGGGIYNYYGDLTLTNVTFTANMADKGGGMYSYHGGQALKNVTFTANIADNGGGMYNNLSTPILTNVTFHGNSAVNRGGGMYNNSSNSILTNVTFHGNLAVNSGGGMYNELSSNPHIRNSIFWGNTAASGAQIYDSGSTPVVSYSVVQGGYTGATNIIADPILGTLGDHGGYTQTIPILPGSSAIDSGNDTVCPTTDQRGISRPQGLHCDIGAYEVVIFSISLPLIMR